MKSRISFFNKTIFQKNLTRFAPAWGLYTICLMMGLFLMLDSGWLPENMGECVQIMCIITPCYALLTAQLLFGDLFNTRMCNALHALPMRRETWYLTNLASGLAFHLIPTAVMGTVATIIMALTNAGSRWIMGPIWFLGVNLQYICFFGLGVFSAFSVGSRFAMAVVYGILNFASIIVAWLVDTLYMPMFYGLQLQEEPFYWFTPIGQMMQNSFVTVERIYDEVWSDAVPGNILPGENFWYYFICAGAGLVLMGIALQMYRKRKLESAGDFMAVKGMEPVFHVIYSLMVGAVFAFVVDDMFGYGSGSGMVFLFIGLGVGYFTGRMLLMRNVRVFQKKGWLGCGVLLAGFGLTLVIAAWDPLGIETWVPGVEDVKSVTIADGHYNYHDCEITLENPEDVEKILALHQAALDEDHRKGAAVEYAVVETVEIMDSDQIQRYTVPLSIKYHLADGRTVSRYYQIWNDTVHGQNLQHWFSSVECVFGKTMDVETLVQKYTQVTVADTFYGEETHYHGETALRDLFKAIVADCEAGTMVQDWDFHMNDSNVCWLYFSDGREVFELRVFSNCENTLNWLRDNGLNVDEILEMQRW